MKVEFDNAKAEGDENPSGTAGGPTDGPVKRPKGGPRKKPVLPSQRRRN